MDEPIDDIWHVFSDGTRADRPFDTVEDKVFGWNSVAICAEIAGVRVWVVTVNDTHFHSLVKGTEERVERYRRLLQQRLQRHFPEDHVHVACRPVVVREKVLSRFMYAYRNCMDFYRKLPGEYPWGCGMGNRFSVNYCGKTLVNASLEIRLKVAARMLAERLSGRSPSLAKALFLQPADLKFLV